MTQEAVVDITRQSISSEVMFVIVTFCSFAFEKTSVGVDRVKVGEGGPVGPFWQDARPRPRMMATAVAT